MKGHDAQFDCQCASCRRVREKPDVDAPEMYETVRRRAQQKAAAAYHNRKALERVKFLDHPQKETA